MSIQISQILWSLTAVVAGGAIGVAFGKVQEAAWRRNQRLQQEGSLNSGWAVMPGSMRRVAYLLVALALVQFLCPLLFTSGFQWWVSAGVVGGYGAMLFAQLRERLARNR